MNKNIYFYNSIKEINDDNAYIAILNYSGSSKKIFLRNIYSAIGIPGDSENFDALNDDYSSFYWIEDKSKIFLIHKSLPKNDSIVDTYLEILFDALDEHISNHNDYYKYDNDGNPIRKCEELYVYFKKDYEPIVKKNLTTT